MGEPKDELDPFIKDIIKLCRKYSGELSHRESDRRQELRRLVDQYAGESVENEN